MAAHACFIIECSIMMAAPRPIVVRVPLLGLVQVEAVPRLLQGGLLCLGNEFDFYQGSLGQVLDGECASGGVGSGEVLGIDLIHGAEVGDVAQEHGGLDHVVQVQSLALQDGTGILEALVSLLLYTPLGECPSLGDNGQLARNEHEIAGADGLAVGPDGGGCLVGV